MPEAVKTKSPDIDFAAVRNDFPVLQQTVNGKPLVYLDNSASSQMPKVVADRLDHYHRNEHSNVHRGVHGLSQKATDAYEGTRKKVKDFIHASRKDEVVFTTGTTDSINLVADSFGREFIGEENEIILSQMEHHANIVPWQQLANRTEAEIKIIPVNEHGELIWDEFTSLLSDKTAIIAITHVSNALGTINPVKKITAEAHKHDIPVLVDGAQAAPHTKVDVQDLGADFYAFSSHKMCGPTGFGVLYGKETYLDKMPPYRTGGEMIDKVSFKETTFDRLPYKFEAGTPPIAAGIGFATAIDYLNDIGMDNIAEREHELLEYGTEKLTAIDGLQIIGTAENKASVISFVFDDIHAHDIGTIIDKKGIAVRTGHHCAQPTMRRFDVSATARASISFYNNKADIDRLAEAVEEAKEFF